MGSRGSFVIILWQDKIFIFTFLIQKLIVVFQETENRLSHIFQDKAHTITLYLDLHVNIVYCK